MRVGHLFFLSCAVTQSIQYRFLIATFNLSDKYFTETRDYGVVSHDPLVLEQVVAGFQADWERLAFDPRLDVGLVWSNVHSRGQMARVIDSAQESLRIQHPKFVDAVILERLVAAQQRGVKVRVLCGFSTPSLWMP